MRLAPEHRLPAAKVAGAALFSVLVAVLIALTGALGLWSISDELWRGPAVIVAGVPCGSTDQHEEVAYQRDGTEHRGTLDACGHIAGETIEVAVGNDTVSDADATAGASTDARPLGVILCAFAGIAGAGFTELYRRSGHVL